MPRAATSRSRTVNGNERRNGLEIAAVPGAHLLFVIHVVDDLHARQIRSEPSAAAAGPARLGGRGCRTVGFCLAGGVIAFIASA